SDVGALPPVRGIAGKTRKPHAHIPPGIDRGGAIGSVGPESVANVGNPVVLAKRQEMPGDGEVERPGAVAKRDGDGVVAGRLSRTGDAVVDGDELLDFVSETMGATNPDFLGDRE